MARRRRRAQMALNGEINVVSLIDVMMLLMVIFMITAPIMQGGIDIRLPQTEARPLESKSGMTVTVRADGKIYVDEDKEPLTVAMFRASFKTLAQNRAKDGVYVKGDANARWDIVAQVMAILRTAGVENIGIVTEPIQEP